jgi:hypothetical protein
MDIIIHTSNDGDKNNVTYFRAVLWICKKLFSVL